MIQFDRFSLDNGLRVLVQQDKKHADGRRECFVRCGARDEDPPKQVSPISSNT